MIGHDRTIPCRILGWSWGLKSWRRRMAVGSGIPLLLEPLLEEPHVTHLSSVAGSQDVAGNQTRRPIWWPSSQCGHQTADFRRYVIIKTYQNCSSAIIQNTQDMLSIVFLAALAPSRIARPTFSIRRSSKKVLRNSVAVNCGKIGELFFLVWLTLQWLTVYQHVYYGMHNTIVYILKAWRKSR